MLTLLWLLPYLFAVSVSTEMELRKALNNGRDVTLNEDIILKLPWMPIPAYGKVFDGNGHTIRNISVSSDVPASQGSGLFSELTGGSISNLNLQFNTTIDNGLILFGGVSAKASNKVRITNVNISGTVSIKSHADGNVTAGCVFGTAGDTGVREPSDAVRSDCIITVNASNASLRLGGFIGVLENNAVTMYYTGKPHVGCYAKRCYIGGFASMATGPVQDIHFTDSVVNATALRHSIVGGIVGHGSNIQLCSSYNVTISVTSTGRVLSGVSVGGAVGETNTENYVINTTFIKASMIILETRSSSYLGGVLGYGKHGGGTITNSYAVIQSLRGYNNGGHMYGGGFLGYGNASSLTLSTCYMFVPEFQFFEKPGAGGHSYYGGFFGLINGSSSDTPSIHSIQAGMGKFEVRMVAQKTNAGNFGGAIEAARTTLLERIVLMGAAGIWSGEAPENAAIFIGKMGPGISLKTILVNISIGNGNDLPNTANFVNTFDGTATDIVYNSGVVKTSQFMPTTGTYKHFNIRVNTTTQVSCESYLKKYGLDSSKVNCADDLYLNKTPSNSQINTDWTFETLDNWEHDPKGWYLPKGMPVANSEINSPALFMTIYLDAKGRTDLSWQQSGWDNGTVWRFGNTNKTDTTKAIPPSFPALWKNPESFLACAPQDCGRESFFSPFMCNCLHGCPGLKNGQCSSYNGATCDEGWKNVGTSLCSGFSCTSKNQLCGDGQVAECDAGSSLCKCKEHEKYYNISTKTCEMGCQGIGHGFCTGPGVAMCDKGWTDGESGLCTVYSCSSDDPATACGGSSVATCVTAYDTCKCTVQTSAYNPANRQCEPNKCAIASGDHICIGENKAICMSNTWPASGASSETLCAHYDCTRHQQCAAGSICDIETFACRCANPAQYFDIADNTCKDGCTDLNTHTGVCIGTNKALCYKGYTSPNSGKPLCSQYSCTDIDPTCGGHGTCSGGTCTCNEGALKFNNTCYANICIQGTVSSQDVCTCNSGWQDDPTLSPLKCTKPSTCPDSININSDVDLIYLYSCGSSTYNLLANVTVSYPWLPVPSFVGVFNGNGHTLKEVRLYENDTIAALFKAIDENARITNLIIEFATSFSSSTIKKVAGLTLDLNGEVLMNVTAAGSIFVKAGVTEVDVGGLASTCTGLRNVTFLGHLAVESHSTVRMGALCASASSPLSDLATDGSISCTSRGRCLVGGLVSSTTHNISSSSSIISITVSSANGLVGGMVSNTTGNLTDLTFKGTVLSPLDSTDIVGGIAGVAKPQLSQLLTVRKCNVVSKAISASSAGGLVGAIEAGVIEESSVTLTAFEGSICAGGLVCNATNTTIAKSNSNIDALRFTANYAEELAKQYCGGFIANATEATIEDSYSVVTISAVKTSSEAFVGGFVGGANELTVKRSYTSGDSVNLVPDNILHFGGFVGSCICNIDSSFSKIALMALNKGKINNAHFGGFVGIIKRTSVREDRAVSTSPQISSSWASSSMSVLLSNPEASRVFYGGFSGEADASTIIDSYTRSNLSVNNDINLYHTGFGAFNGRFNELETNITRCYADVGIDGATDLNFEGNSAYGKRCVKCTRVLINNDQPGISDEDACGRTAVELQKSETIMKAFGSIDAFAFVPGRMPMIVTTPNLDSVTHTYAYPSCNPSTQGNCWDYKDIWIVSPDGIGSAATAPGCKVSSCTYCDARDSGVCRICASQTFLDSRKTCSVCSSSCAECATRESFCTACKRTGAMPDMNGVCIMPRLSSAAIAGISIVVILVVSGVVGFLCWWFICRSKGNPIEKPAHTLEPSVSTVGISASIL